MTTDNLRMRCQIDYTNPNTKELKSIIIDVNSEIEAVLVDKFIEAIREIIVDRVDKRVIFSNIKVR